MSNNIIPEAMAFEPDELLNSAIMSKTPVLVVEGHDDIPLYERLVQTTNKECEVYASENLSGTEGCEGVIGVINAIREYSQDIEIEKFILGVIDRDSRPYRGGIPEDTAILMLNLYSIESHFATEEALKLIVHRTTGATGALFDADDANKLFNNIKIKLEKLYLLSLEALKNACNNEYESEYGYSDKLKAILGRGFPEAFNKEKSDTLREFAGSIQLNESWEEILKICKGKWVLELFLDELRVELKNLPAHCKQSTISKCQYCINSTFHKCLYRINGTYSTPILTQIIKQESNLESLRYIRDRIESLEVILG